MGGNNGWGQTWLHTFLEKCERHWTLVGIHWLTINAKKIFLSDLANPRKSASRYDGKWKGMGEASNCSHLCLYAMPGTYDRSSQPSLRPT